MPYRRQMIHALCYLAKDDSMDSESTGISISTTDSDGGRNDNDKSIPSMYSMYTMSSSGRDLSPLYCLVHGHLICWRQSRKVSFDWL